MEGGEFMATLSQYKRGYKQEREARKNAEAKVKVLGEYITELEEQLADKGIEITTSTVQLVDDLKDLRSELEQEKIEHEETKKKLELKNEECERLKNRLNKNSQNSSKPSSTNGYKKIHNSRVSSDKPVGGQLGHKGTNLKMVDTPDIIIEKKVEHCECGGIVKQDGTYQRKQVFDLIIKRQIREERSCNGTCTCCGKKHKGKFSTKAKHHVEYGQELNSFITLLSSEGFVSYDKIKSILEQITEGEISPSKGTLVHATRKAGESCEATVEKLKEKLRQEPVLYVDETSVKLDGNLYWGHTATSEDTVVIEAFDTRGFLSLMEMDILSGFPNVIMCDHYAMYNKLTEATPARCNAHILREAQSIFELHARLTNTAFCNFLREINKWVNGRKTIVDEATPDEKAAIMTKYHTLVNEWHDEMRIDFNAWEKKHPKKSKTQNPYNEERLLIERLQNYAEAHMRFVLDFNVRFDNNMAERSLRMIKTKMKIAGTFRSYEQMKSFFLMRSIIQTMKLRGENFYQVIRAAFSNTLIPIPE